MAFKFTPNATTVNGSKLPSVQSLFVTSWQFAKDRLDLVGWFLAVMVAVSLIPLIANYLMNLLAGNAVTSVLGALVGVVLGLAMLWFLFVTSLGLWYAVAQSETTSLWAGSRWAAQHFWSLLLVGMLLSLCLLAAWSLALFPWLALQPTLMGNTALIPYLVFGVLTVPGLVVLVYNLFLLLTFIEGHRGIHALAASTQTVYDQFWAVGTRILVLVGFISVASFALTALSNRLLEISDLPVVDYAAALVTLPVSIFVAVIACRYLVLMYQALRERLPEYRQEIHARSVAVYRMLAFSGGLLIAIMFIAALLATWFA